MELSNTMKIRTLVTRELQEFRTSLVITPLVVAGALAVLMLLGVLFGGRLVMLGDNVVHVISGQGEGGSVNFEVTIDSDNDKGTDELKVRKFEEDAALPLQPLKIEENPADVSEEAWNFSQSWSFSAPAREKVVRDGEEWDSANPLFMGLNSLFLFILFIVSVNYLLGSLYNDRKDKSILFWKSMPVSEWQEVLCKLSVGVIVAPVIYLAVSLVAQGVCMLLAALLIWRMDGSAGEFLASVQLAPLVFNQIGGMLVMVMFVLPAYAWFMLCSAFSKRSPFLLAIAVPIGLVIAERLLFGSFYVAQVIGRHMPRMIDGNDAASVGFYEHGPVWGSLDYVGMVMGLGTAAAFLAGAAWLRRHRFET